MVYSKLIKRKGHIYKVIVEAYVRAHEGEAFHMVRVKDINPGPDPDLNTHVEVKGSDLRGKLLEVNEMINQRIASLGDRNPKPPELDEFGFSEDA